MPGADLQLVQFRSISSEQNGMRREERTGYVSSNSLAKYSARLAPVVDHVRLHDRRHAIACFVRFFGNVAVTNERIRRGAAFTAEARNWGSLIAEEGLTPHSGTITRYAPDRTKLLQEGAVSRGGCVHYLPASPIHRLGGGQAKAQGDLTETAAHSVPASPPIRLDYLRRSMPYAWSTYVCR